MVVLYELKPKAKAEVGKDNFYYDKSMIKVRWTRAGFKEHQLIIVGKA